jgi:hypothetical protein
MAGNPVDHGDYGPRAMAAIVKRISELAQSIAFQSDTASSELAGQMLSVLARDPSLIDRFMRDGSEMFLEGAFMPERGMLSWYGQNGQIVTPEVMRELLGKRDH